MLRNLLMIYYEVDYIASAVKINGNMVKYFKFTGNIIEHPMLKFVIAVETEDNDAIIENRPSKITIKNLKRLNQIYIDILKNEDVKNYFTHTYGTKN